MLLAVACRRAGMPLVPRWPRMTPGVKRVILLSGPGIVSGGIMQVNLLVATMIATGFDRAVPYLYYADRLYQLPLGVIGVAIGVVLLPDLSRKLRAGNEQGAMTSQNRAMELSLFLTLPATVALIVIAVPLINALFEHGAFTHSDTLAVAPTVAAFAAGLPAFSMTKVFQPGYFAREDTRTPMRIAMLSVVVNIIGSLVLSQFFAHVGIAMATAIAAWVNTACLGLVLKRRGLLCPRCPAQGPPAAHGAGEPRHGGGAVSPQPGARTGVRAGRQRYIEARRPEPAGGGRRDRLFRLRPCVQGDDGRGAQSDAAAVTAGRSLSTGALEIGRFSRHKRRP